MSEDPKIGSDLFSVTVPVGDDWRTKVLDALHAKPLATAGLAEALACSGPRDKARLKKALGELHDEGAIKHRDDRWILASWKRCATCKAKGWVAVSKTKECPSGLRTCPKCLVSGWVPQL